MRYYFVPFKTENESKFLFELSVQESIIIGIFLVIGLVLAKIISDITGVFFLYTIPLAIPFFLLGAFLTFKKVKHLDCEIPFYLYLLLSYQYNRKPRHYLKNFSDWREQQN